MKALFLISLVATLLLAQSGNQEINSFSKAKKLLTKKVYNEESLRTTIYADCKYESKRILKSDGRYMNKLVIDKKSCNYTPRTRSKRANFVEYEHAVPAHAFGHNLTCWKVGNDRCVKRNGKKYKGRRCCSKVNKKFKLMAADLFNLHPSVGELNADRSNFTFSMLPGEPRKYGAVDFEVDFKARKVEPNPSARGIIARTYFYMSNAYSLPISSKQKKLFTAWNKMYPMTEKEKYIIMKKEKIQKNKMSY